MLLELLDKQIEAFKILRTNILPLKNFREFVNNVSIVLPTIARYEKQYEKLLKETAYLLKDSFFADFEERVENRLYEKLQEEKSITSFRDFQKKFVRGAGELTGDLLFQPLRKIDKLLAKTEACIATLELCKQEYTADEKGKNNMSDVAKKPVETFICYTSLDKSWYEQLVNCLSVLQEKHVLVLKDRREIGLRAEWRQQIHPGMRSAQLILLLLNQEFITSGYLSDNEMQQALERYERGEVRIAVIMLRPMLWRENVILRHLPFLLDQKEPLSTRDNKIEAFEEIAKGIAQICQDLPAPETSNVSRNAVAPEQSPRPHEAIYLPAPLPEKQTVAAQSKQTYELSLQQTALVDKKNLEPSHGDESMKQPVKRTNNKVFVCYSHEDEPWLNRLQIHLKPNEQAGELELWHDKKIAPGLKWREEIQKAIETSAAAVLLISADFLASDFITDFELPLIMARVAAGKMTIFSLIISPCQFSASDLEIFQAINSPKKTLRGMNHVEQDETFTQLAEEIKKLFRKK